MSDAKPANTSSSESIRNPESKASESKAKSKRGENDRVIIKKYANRRLYNTSTSAYVTLDNLSAMVRDGVDFVVFDAKSGDDITRTVLAQIIFDEESQSDGQNLLPIQFLRQLIGFYGNSMQNLLPTYLEMSLDGFTKQQERIKSQYAQAFGANAFGGNSFVGKPSFGVFDEQVSKNLAMFDSAMRMFSPFSMSMSGGGTPSEAADPQKTPPVTPKPSDNEVSQLREEIEAMKSQLDRLANKS